MGVTAIFASRRASVRLRSRTMQIIDAQIHLWATGLPSNPTHWAVTHFTAEEAITLMAEGGIDAAVIHPPDWDPARQNSRSGRCEITRFA